MTVRPIFAWYDLWVGLFWDRVRRRLYIMPLPMLGVVLDFGEPAPDQGRYLAECVEHCSCCPCCQDVPCVGETVGPWCDRLRCIHDDFDDDRSEFEDMDELEVLR